MAISYAGVVVAAAAMHRTFVNRAVSSIVGAPVDIADPSRDRPAIVTLGLLRIDVRGAIFPEDDDSDDDAELRTNGC